MTDYWKDKPEELSNLLMQIVDDNGHIKHPAFVAKLIEAYTEEMCKKLLAWYNSTYEDAVPPEDILKEFKKTLIK